MTEPTPRPAAVVLGGSVLACELVLALLRATDVAIADDAHPGDAGLVAVLVDPDPAHWDTARVLQAPVVLLSLDVLPDHEIVACVVNGAEAVLHGDTDARKLEDAIMTVASGGSYLPAMQMRAVADALRAQVISSDATPRLTGREVDILSSIDRGESIKQTARVLGISRKTVENLQTRLFRKLAVRNRAQAIARAHALGLFPNIDGLDDTPGEAASDLAVVKEAAISASS